MYVIKKKQFVCTGLRKNEDGYTFTSLLLTLTIVIITLPVLVLLLQIIKLEPNESHLDAHHFFDFLYRDALVAKDVEIDENENIVYFWIEEEDRKADEARASIEKYGRNIIRRVEGRGHEIYIRNINAFHVTPVSFGFQVQLTMENGEKYEKTIEFTKGKE